MAKVKVNVDVKFKVLEDLKLLESKTVLGLIAPDIMDEIKSLISKGISPVKGFGRFEAYKAQARKTKGKSSQAGRGYPYSVMKKYPDKKVRPVNLKLTGDMLNALVWEIFAGKIKIGIFDKTQKEKAALHQEGSDSVPQRRFIPSSKGEDFTISVRRVIKERISFELGRILEKSNRK